LIEIKNVEEDVEITFPDPDIEYVVYAKDTKGNLHILKTYDQEIGNYVFKKEQGDYVIDEIYVQISNNTNEEKDTTVTLKIKSKSKVL
jgi:hypothetical protein